MLPFALALLAAAAPLPAAAAETRSVALVVTDAEGAFVPGIRADKVRVLENGEPREIVAFERDDRPLGVARVFRGQAFDAVWSFLTRLPAGSICTLWTTGDHARKIGELRGARPEIPA